MPSWPDIPIPTSAAWIILTSFAPSPRVGRQDGIITVQATVPPSEEGNNLSYDDYFKYSVLPCVLIRRTDARHQGSGRGLSPSQETWLNHSKIQDWDWLGGNTANPNTIYISIILCFCLAKFICSGTCFATPYFIEFSESATKLIADDNVNKPVSRTIFLISTCSNMLNR